MTAIGHLGARDDPTISFDELRLSRSLDHCTEVIEAVEVIETAEVLRPR